MLAVPCKAPLADLTRFPRIYNAVAVAWFWSHPSLSAAVALRAGSSRHGTAALYHPSDTGRPAGGLGVQGACRGAC